MDDEYYKILGINKTADNATIKKAYKSLALKWHPDKNKSPDAPEMFKKITEAYGVLSDDTKRKTYDTFGKNGLNGQQPAFQNMNVFEQMFGFDFFGNGQNGFPNPNFPHNDIIQMDVHISYVDVCLGKLHNDVISRTSPCKTCNATGFDDGVLRKCTKCSGQKFIQICQQRGPITTIQNITCPKCNGSGIDDGDEHVCRSCSGKRVKKENYNVSFQIPIGTINGDNIVVQNEGNYDISTRQRSHIIVMIHVDNPDGFCREKFDKYRVSPYDIFTTIHLSLAESLCGFSKTINSFDNSKITIKTSSLTHNGDIYASNGNGLCSKNKQKGNLYIKMIVDKIELDPQLKQKLWTLLSDKPYEDPNKQTITKCDI